MSGSSFLIDAAVYIILVILLDAQIALSDGERGVIENNHDHNRITALFPRMIAKSLAQGMTADMLLDTDSLGCGNDHAVCLGARKR